MHRRNDRTEPLRRRRLGCAPARPALHVSTLLFGASATRSCSFGAEALAISFSCFEFAPFLDMRRRIAQERVLPGHAASNEENSTRLRGAQSHKSTADPTTDPSDPRRRLVRPLSNQISALHSGRPTLLILRPLCYLCYLLFKSFCFPSVEIFAALL
jgi:hypothetical protein